MLRFALLLTAIGDLTIRLALWPRLEWHLHGLVVGAGLVACVSIGSWAFKRRVFTRTAWKGALALFVLLMLVFCAVLAQDVFTRRPDAAAGLAKALGPWLTYQLVYAWIMYEYAFQSFDVWGHEGPSAQ